MVPMSSSDDLLKELVSSHALGERQAPQLPQSAPRESELGDYILLMTTLRFSASPSSSSENKTLVAIYAQQASAGAPYRCFPKGEREEARQGGW
jgi:hypothetical protein